MGDSIRLRVGLVGLSVMTVGLWFAWPPLAGIVPGALLLAAAVVGHFRSVPKQED